MRKKIELISGLFLVASAFQCQAATVTSIADVPMNATPVININYDQSFNTIHYSYNRGPLQQYTFAKPVHVQRTMTLDLINYIPYDPNPYAVPSPPNTAGFALTGSTSEFLPYNEFSIDKKLDPATGKPNVDISVDHIVQQSFYHYKNFAYESGYENTTGAFYGMPIISVRIPIDFTTTSAFPKTRSVTTSSYKFGVVKTMADIKAYVDELIGKPVSMLGTGYWATCDYSKLTPYLIASKTCGDNPTNRGEYAVLGDFTITGSSLGYRIVKPYSATSVTAASVSAVPVPAAVWLFGSGLLGLVGVARRQRR